MKLWKTTTGEVLHTFRGHTADLMCVAFSPDGQQIASAGIEQTVKVWKVPPVDDRPDPGVAPGK